MVLNTSAPIATGTYTQAKLPLMTLVYAIETQDVITLDSRARAERLSQSAFSANSFDSPEDMVCEQTMPASTPIIVFMKRNVSG